MHRRGQEFHGVNGAGQGEATHSDHFFAGRLDAAHRGKALDSGPGLVDVEVALAADLGDGRGPAPRQSEQPMALDRIDTARWRVGCVGQQRDERFLIEVAHC